MNESADFAERAKAIAEQLEPGIDQVAKAAKALAKLRMDYDNARQNVTWDAFADEHFPHWSARYIRKLIEIGKRDDPAAALRAYREASKERSKQARAKVEAEKQAAAEHQAPADVRTSTLEPEPAQAEAPGAPAQVATVTQLHEKRREQEDWEVLWQFYTDLEPAARAQFDARWREAHTLQLVPEAAQPLAM